MPVARSATASLLVSSVLAISTSPAAAYAPAGSTVRVSVSSEGIAGDAGSWASALSEDGSAIAFTSAAANLVPDDTNGQTDVFVHDRGTGRTERVSMGTGGVEPNGPSDGPAISRDGRYVAFHSTATNIGGSGGASSPDVYLHDRQTGVTVLLGKGSKPGISANGGVVVWETGYEIKVWDRATGAVTRADVDGDGVGSTGAAGDASVSADGRYVAFHSTSSFLDRAEGGSDIDFDVFVHDRVTRETEIVSISTEDQAGNSDSWQSAISGNGLVVAFWSYATNFVPNQQVDLQMFVHDRVTRRTELVSIATDGRAGDWWAWGRPAISHDGRFIAFRDGAENLAANDGNGTFDIFVHDRVTGVTELVAVTATGFSGPGDSSLPAMTPDGRHVSFSSRVAGFVAEDDNDASDVFVRDLGPTLGVGGLSAERLGDGSVRVEGWSSLAGAVVSAAADAPNDGGLTSLAGGEITRASLTYRPEQEDLFVRVSYRDLVGLRGQNLEPASKTFSSSGLAGHLYGFGFRVGSVAYELRASGATEHGATVQPRIVLFRCDPGCVEAGRPKGGLGIAGVELRASVPMVMLGAKEGDPLSGLRASTAFGEIESGALRQIDEVTLPDGSIPASSVSIGIAPVGASEDEVAFDVAAAVTGGLFSASIPNVGEGPHDVWARACLGTTCGTARTPAG